MTIGFVNFTPLTYSVDTPYTEPLGGSESAMCYLCVHLAGLGHQVILFGRKPMVFTSRGVLHHPDQNLYISNHPPLDYLVIQNTPFFGMQLKPRLPISTKLIFWNQHNPDQAPLRVLHSPQFMAIYDAVVFVSSWHQESSFSVFRFNPKKSHVIANAISPAFEHLSPQPKSLSLAYTTVPHRGLSVLLDIFPSLRLIFPDLTLKVYSGMRVYQQPNDPLAHQLITRSRTMPGVEHHDPVGQTDLSQALSHISILAYPNIVPETYCIGIPEAQAAGCLVVTTAQGAIPDTAAGFAKLVPPSPDYQTFVSSYTSALHQAITDLPVPDSDLARQVDHVRSHTTWAIRTQEWENLLKTL